MGTCGGGRRKKGKGVERGFIFLEQGVKYNLNMTDCYIWCVCDSVIGKQDRRRFICHLQAAQ